MSERHEVCYVVWRFDLDQVKQPPSHLTSGITLKEIVWTPTRAQEEVDRLNKLNSDKGCYYGWTISRAEKK